MESSRSINVENPRETSKNLSRILKKIIPLVVFLTISTVLFASFLGTCSSLRGGSPSINHTSSSSSSSSFPKQGVVQHPIIKNACGNTLYPSLCYSTLSSMPSAKNATTFHRILDIALNHSLFSALTSQSHINTLLGSYQDLSLMQKNALMDCSEMLDQTLYELGEAIGVLHSIPDTATPFLGKSNSFNNIKTLLSAAMTNGDTCIDGFSDLEEADYLQWQNQNHEGLALRGDLQEKLIPLSRMMSNCLAMIKRMETLNLDMEFVDPQRILMQKILVGQRFPAWMSSGDQKLMHGVHRVRLRPDVVVAKDGSGDFSTIGDAVRMAPNMSTNRFMIKIKAGVYKENVEIPRRNTNIMLIGDGMNSTVITSSRNLVDGFSTFASATLSMNYSRTMVMKSYLGDLIHPRGWSKWNLYSKTNTVEYIEYMNFGPGSNTTHRVKWRGYRKNCSQDLAKKFTVETFFHGTHNWLESTGFPLFYVTQRGKLSLEVNIPPSCKMKLEANIPARNPIGIERLPWFLCRAPERTNDKSQNPGIAHGDLKFHSH
ncbi:Pectinesterase, catalytic [Dillenia turbinata]|uniref:Pectinesterase, catalytic n=1 Tax=Dillenia turbinata TaxID=194707 RepID=A0AAN8ZTG6_9MAGN